MPPFSCGSRLGLARKVNQTISQHFPISQGRQTIPGDYGRTRFPACWLLGVSADLLFFSRCTSLARGSAQRHQMMAEEFLDNLIDRQAHDIAVGTGDRLDQERSLALNAVGAGLVQGFSALDISLEDIVGKGIKGHQGGYGAQLDNGPVLHENGKTGDNLMGLPLESFQSGQSLVPVSGFAEKSLIKGDHGVGPNDAGIGGDCGNVLGFAQGHPPGKTNW